MDNAIDLITGTHGAIVPNKTRHTIGMHALGHILQEIKLEGISLVIGTIGAAEFTKIDRNTLLNPFLVQSVHLILIKIFIIRRILKFNFSGMSPLIDCSCLSKLIRTISMNRDHNMLGRVIGNDKAIIQSIFGVCCVTGNTQPTGFIVSTGSSNHIYKLLIPSI